MRTNIIHAADIKIDMNILYSNLTLLYLFAIIAVMMVLSIIILNVISKDEEYASRKLIKPTILFLLLPIVTTVIDLIINSSEIADVTKLITQISLFASVIMFFASIAMVLHEKKLDYKTSILITLIFAAAVCLVIGTIMNWSLYYILGKVLLIAFVADVFVTIALILFSKK